MNVLEHLFAVIPMLGILIFVHELGHFLVAKACGVRVLKFSIGFGAPIGFGDHRMRWERNGTEYVVGWIPLGGFVRMLGESFPGDEEIGPPVPEDARPDEYLEAKPVWQKLSIVFAGPAMNLILPVICLMGILWVGLPRPDAVIGMVEPDSPAAEAGLLPGDRVLSIDGEPVRWWDEVITGIRESDSGETLRIAVERGVASPGFDADEDFLEAAKTERREIELDAGSHTMLDRFGSVTESGWVGIGHQRLSALLGVPNETSLAAAAGLRSGDLVVAVGETPVESWDELRAALRAASPGSEGGPRSQTNPEGLRTLPWTVERHSEKVFGALPGGLDEKGPKPEPQQTLRIDVAAGVSLEALGLVPAPILVHVVTPGKPADRAGLARGDLILSVDGKPVGSFGSFASLIQTSGGRELELTYSRAGSVSKTRLRAEETVVPGPYDIEGMEQKVYRVGIGNALSSLPGARAVDQVRNPIVALPRAATMSWQMTKDFLEGLGKLFTGEVGTDQLSGPIGIARIARKSLDRGWLDYLTMMMLISINLGILNLLPIPILDGGQALIYSIEGIKRSPVSLRTREFAAQLGFGVLVLLMGRAFWNDLTPFWSQFVRWLGENR
jgi:regulator of sigma E protease